MHMMDALCFLLPLRMCTPHATSKKSLLAQKGAVEYAWIVLFDPDVLALCRVWLWMVPGLAVELEVCVRVSVRRLKCRSTSFVMIGGESLLFVRVWGQVLRPPTGGSA